MSHLNTLNAFHQISLYLAKYEITVEYHTNFDEFEQIAKEVRGKKSSGQFRKKFFDFTEDNSMWVMFLCKGEPVAVQAGRYDRLGPDRTLVKHWEDQQKRIYPKPNRLGDNHAAHAQLMSGNIIFSGEFSLREDLRGKEIAGLMIYQGMLSHFTKWNQADWIYSFMNEERCKRGFAVRMGFNHMEPQGTHWLKEPKGIANNDWFLASSRRAFVRAAGLIGVRGVEVLLPQQRD
ncbi:MAG: hypothetical protein AAF412_06965 [Pseudomonadota bacterium]